MKEPTIQELLEDTRKMNKEADEMIKRYEIYKDEYNKLINLNKELDEMNKRYDKLIEKDEIDEILNRHYNIIREIFHETYKEVFGIKRYLYIPSIEQHLEDEFEEFDELLEQFQTENREKLLSKDIPEDFLNENIIKYLM